MRVLKVNYYKSITLEMTTAAICDAFATLLPQLTEELEEWQGIVRITTENLNLWRQDAPQGEIEEKMIDCLSCYSAEQLEALTVPPVLQEIVTKAKHRDIGDIFLYPNRAILSRYGTGDRTISDIRRIYTTPGWHVSMQCWITSNKNNNWPRHGYGIDEYLPLGLFLGKKEGDTILFKHNQREVKLRLQQSGYRYRLYGKFDYLCLQMAEKCVTSDLLEGLTLQEQAQLIKKETQEYEASL